MSFQDHYRKLLKLLRIPSKDLFSEQFYDALNYDYFGLEKYRDKCKKAYTSDKRIRSKKICEKILRHLENSTIWNDENSGYDVCILLNYWVYDTLTALFGADNNAKIVAAFGKLQPIWNELIADDKQPAFFNKCAPDHDIPSQNDWKSRKELYDYCVNYALIESVSKYYNVKCRDYYKYIEGKTSLYTYFEQLCNTNEEKCPKSFKRCQAYNPTLVLHKLECHEKIKAERSAAEKDLALQNSLRQEFGSNSDTEKTSENSEIGKKVGHSVIGIAPVVLTASVLYKYTPIRSWIHKLGGTNQHSISDMDGGEMESFLYNTQGSGNMFFGDTENYISYQPM
ncbi:PIR Superfamily Protein [Plasmodium ovale curtisi]|uniref:PIR Superfamily Protein n=1 Tax=Plasmodium ovale curtisi TaxID=864141 RepID=A0A1A8X728_PLAOA|nr:PIR Superfamily Protein [Plasmodium ovale curtisi]